MGHRTGKAYTENNQITYTWYVRDAQGNPMATYEQKTVNNLAQIKLIELPIYGSSRLGMLQPNKLLTENTPVNSSFSIGRKQYEISNHLGNVLTTISDAKQAIDNNTDGVVDYYKPIIKTQQDYYPFGMLMPERQYVAENNPYPCVPCNEIAEAAKQCFIENGVNCTMANIQANLPQGLINSSFVLEDLYSYCQFTINENEIIWDENANQAALLCPEKNGPYLTHCEGAPSTEQYQNCVPCGQLSNALQAYYLENGPLPETFLFSSLGISNAFDNYTTSLAQLQDLCNFTFNIVENNPPTVTFDEPNGAEYFLCADETVLPPYNNPCPQIEVAVSEIPVEYNDCVPCDAIAQALIANYIENGPFPNAFTLSVSPSFENYLTSLSALQNLCNFTFHVDGNNAPTIDFAEENGAAYYLCPNETVLPPFTEEITAVSGCLPCQDIEQALQTYYLEYGSNATPPTLNALYGVSPELAELNIDFNTYSGICGFTIDFDSNNLPVANWTNPTPSTSYFCLVTYTKAPDAENLAYRYGFNGKENDNEIIGKGRWQDYGMRMYRPDLGRFFSVDPIAKEYPWNSPFSFAENRCIQGIDLDGLEFKDGNGNNVQVNPSMVNNNWGLNQLEINFVTALSNNGIIPTNSTVGTANVPIYQSMAPTPNPNAQTLYNTKFQIAPGSNLGLESWQKINFGNYFTPLLDGAKEAGILNANGSISNNLFNYFVQNMLNYGADFGLTPATSSLNQAGFDNQIQNDLNSRGVPGNFQNILNNRTILGFDVYRNSNSSSQINTTDMNGISEKDISGFPVGTFYQNSPSTPSGSTLIPYKDVTPPCSGTLQIAP